ncbi:hypothetical protein HanRHA438_Chr14g0666011 [Helianthus annuus]|nr:hypothetical protein HanRHA438_Chr14g0666011 [Helianthus annuus]
MVGWWFHGDQLGVVVVGGGGYQSLDTLVKKVGGHINNFTNKLIEKLTLLRSKDVKCEKVKRQGQEVLRVDETCELVQTIGSKITVYSSLYI